MVLLFSLCVLLPLTASSPLPLTDRELQNRVVALTKARPTLLRTALSEAKSSLLRTALTRALPGILEVALTKAKPELLKVALQQSTPENLIVALTYAGGSSFGEFGDFSSKPVDYLPTSPVVVEDETNFFADIISQDEDTAKETIPGYPVKEDNTDIIEVGSDDSDIVVVGEEDDLIVNEDGSVIFQGQEFTQEEVDQAVTDLLVALLVESMLNGEQNTEGDEEIVVGKTFPEEKQEQVVQGNGETFERSSLDTEKKDGVNLKSYAVQEKEDLWTPDAPQLPYLLRNPTRLASHVYPSLYYSVPPHSHHVYLPRHAYTSG